MATGWKISFVTPEGETPLSNSVLVPLVQCRSCPAQTCPAGFVWDPFSCSCFPCSETACPPGQVWSQADCACVPSSGTNTISAQLSNLSWRLPGGSLGGGTYGPAFAPADQIVTLTAPSPGLFNVTLLIRGILEYTHYLGGTPGSAPQLVIDPAGEIPAYNVYTLTVSDPFHVYALNNGDITLNSPHLPVVDYTFIAPMRVGATVTLHVATLDNTAVYNPYGDSFPIIPGEPPIVVPQPYFCQFLQMNVLNVSPI